MSVEFLLVDNEATLNEVLQNFEQNPPAKIAIDTEFIPEKTYIPKLCLVQVCVDEQIYLFDPIKTDLKPLADYFEQAEIIFHSGSQDLFLLEILFDRKLTNYFDTQIAASLISCSGKRSYSDLCKKYLGFDVAKGETLTKWDARPLSKKQLKYAANDVLHLFPLYERLTEKIEYLDRWSWVKEEFQKLHSQVANLSANDDNFLKIKNLWKLKPDEIGIAKELYYWREEQAILKNQKPKQILTDHQITQIAVSRPENIKDLLTLRGIPKKLFEKYGDEILEVVLKGYDTEVDEMPERPAPSWLSPEQKTSHEFLELVIKLIAINNKVSDIYLTEGKVLNKLVKAKRNHTRDEFIMSLHGWRKDLLMPYFEAYFNNDIIVKPSKSGKNLEVVINGKKNGNNK